MSVLTAIQRATSVLGLNTPASIYSTASPDREAVELADLCNEVASTIALNYDWQALKAIYTINGPGSTFSLPPDYQRMFPDTIFRNTTRPMTPLQHVPDLDDWLSMTLQSFIPPCGAWSIFSNAINLFPALAAGEAIKFAYLTNGFVKTASGTIANIFTKDDDTFLLNGRLLQLGIIWQWRCNKGLPYAEDMQNYESALAQIIASDKGAKTIVMGAQRKRSGADYAFPWTITP